jgi:hypothetical protein
MKRKERKYEVVAAAANAGRDQRAMVTSQVAAERDVQHGAPPMIEVSDADYRTVHLPCDALEESAQQIKKGRRKPRD